MNRDITTVLRPVLALLVFLLVALQTAGALRESGVWARRGVRAAAAPDDPLASVEPLLVRDGTPPPARDPFTAGPVVPATHAAPVPVRPAVPAAPPRPVLTAIVWDADPRALVRWKGRDWTVRPGTLFDEFQVTAITRDQVTLVRGTETILLHQSSQGD